MLERTRIGIEVKNLKMRVESMSRPAGFRRAPGRAPEGVVVCPAGLPSRRQPPGGEDARPGSEAEASERRNRAAAPAPPPAGERGEGRQGEPGQKAARALTPDTQRPRARPCDPTGRRQTRPIREARDRGPAIRR